jgi:outer membrane protein assembly factor BamB
LKKNTINIITILLIFVYTGVFIWWFSYDSHAGLTTLEPGADERPASLARSADDVRIGEFFMKYEVDENHGFSGKWARFRGENYTNILVTGEINIPENEYPIVWTLETGGEGHAAPAIYNGRVYLLDYDEKLNSDMLRCLNLTDGKEIWRRWYRVPMKRNHGFSRTIPAISDKYLITIGPKGHVMCLEPTTGNLLWTLDIEKTYETEVPFWYTGQCPLIDNETAIFATGGKALLTGVDCNTGKTLWETPNDRNYKMSHSSVIPMMLAGKRTYVYMAIGGICGISAEPADLGKLLWTAEKWSPSVIAPSPLQIGANSLFLVAGYGAGASLLNITQSGGKFTATTTLQYKANEGAASEQQTPLLYKNKLYTVLPKDGGSMRNRLVTYSPDNLQAPLWASGTDERFGLGPYLIINDYLYIFKEEGELYVYQLTGKEPKLLKRQVIIEGVDAWGPMAYADGYLIVRDAHHVVALKIIPGNNLN